jgi:hypothetical protein
MKKRPAKKKPREWWAVPALMDEGVYVLFSEKKDANDYFPPFKSFKVREFLPRGKKK